MICFMVLAGSLLPTSPFQPAGSSRLHKHLFWWRGRLLCHSCSSCCLSLNDGLQAFREILNVLENARHVLFCKFFLLAFPLAFLGIAWEFFTDWLYSWHAGIGVNIRDLSNLVFHLQQFHASIGKCHWRWRKKQPRSDSVQEDLTFCHFLRS